MHRSEQVGAVWSAGDGIPTEQGSNGIDGLVGGVHKSEDATDGGGTKADALALPGGGARSGPRLGEAVVDGISEERDVCGGVDVKGRGCLVELALELGRTPHKRGWGDREGDGHRGDGQSEEPESAAESAQGFAGIVIEVEQHGGHAGRCGQSCRVTHQPGEVRREGVLQHADGRFVGAEGDREAREEGRQAQGASRTLTGPASERPVERGSQQQERHAAEDGADHWCSFEVRRRSHPSVRRQLWADGPGTGVRGTRAGG